MDRELGYKSFWDLPFQFRTLSQGVATHVLAAFHPSLEESGAYILLSLYFASTCANFDK